MKRTLMQVYIKNTMEAAKVYQEAFNAELGYHVMNDDATTYYHAELNVYGQILALAEWMDSTQQPITGTTMQFCLHFEQDEEPLIHQAFAVLSKDATIFTSPQKCDFSDCMADFIDRFGVRWCLFS